MLKTNETGRSMVEMLGVLAIIGVLSVGGITGYTSAMRSYKANEIVNATSMLYAMAASQNVGKGDKDLSYTAVLGSLPSGCTGIDYSGSSKTISVKIEDQAVCNQVKNKFGTKITAGGCITPSSGVYVLQVTLNAFNAQEIMNRCLGRGGYEQECAGIVECVASGKSEDCCGCLPSGGECYGAGRPCGVRQLSGDPVLDACLETNPYPDAWPSETLEDVSDCLASYSCSCCSCLLEGPGNLSDCAGYCS